MNLRATPLGLFTAEKTFAHRWVGNRQLNRLGLHLGRFALARLAGRLRTMFTHLPASISGPLAKDGVAIARDFLSCDRFAALKGEAHAAEQLAAESTPISPSGERGFGKRRPFDGGFDRYDGGTLNRFLRLDGDTASAVGSDIAGLGAGAAGSLRYPEKVQLQLLVHGEAPTNHDPQTDLHRDTFHPAFKAWLFLDDVTAEHGPFHYVIGSHRPTWRRIAWEYREACRAAESSGGGAFRIGERDLECSGYDEPKAFEVPANTLVIANVAGFHRRGIGLHGATRRALHGSFRPSPFVPIPY